MIECKETNEQILIPVFYNVDPSYVRHQRGEYGDALAKHEENFKEAQSLRSALKKASLLSGFHYPKNFENESDLVDEIVEDVLEKLIKFCPSESNGLVGIDQNIAQIQSLLILDSREVIFLGIWGMVGIGKTAIARAVFDKYSPQYDGCCFLNVREELEQCGLSFLRVKLLSELLDGENLRRNGTSKARYVEKRLSRKKVFIVLDDVHSSEQLKYLVGESVCFGPGSRVIVTSRDKHELVSGGVHQIHEVKEMDFQDSLKLFCLNAFNESQPKMGYEKLSKKVVDYAKGNPLALKVLGSDFHSRSEDTWKCALRKLKKYPNEKIQSLLRFSYDGLHEVEKNAFLDIAFFFKEEDKDYVIRLLDAWGFYGASGIEALQRKALITISNDNRIQMHDWIQEMGCEIVRQESIKYPERRSRLRDNEEVYAVLRNNQGTDEMEAIQIDVSQIRDLTLSIDTFRKMRRLRFLKLYYPLHVELSMPPSHNHPYILSLQQQVALILSGCKELMSIGSEIHIKCLHYLLIDGCSGSKESSVLPKEIRQQNLTNPGMDMLNSSIGHLNNIEWSDRNGIQFKNLPNELFCMRSVYYLRHSKSRGQDSGKPKLHILFDGLSYSQRISLKELYDLRELALPQNISAFSSRKSTLDGSIVESLPRFIIQSLDALLNESYKVFR
ncbi:disease resistance protein RUN1-like [Gastrolobium bilobum]|uniref:disease resistance protein RUN1-like n=1 Tax=Gastrolobium bilobum TaxID=150636 RepID=UPI002AAFA781|nr:disease resistance protein RUN1-like [Gastrolobium bilobum]